MVNYERHSHEFARTALEHLLEAERLLLAQAEVMDRYQVNGQNPAAVSAYAQALIHLADAMQRETAERRGSLNQSLDDYRARHKV
ncbi:hypothetical protein [Mycobacterium paraense]|uniref:hypothetical protein n=1 Tax=Mycobacterium paraense TaxID=767916 RepID=UPI00111BFD35|nr:hypothetical protein [Mycobacterium paraense]